MTRICQHEIITYFNSLKELIKNKKVKNEFIVKDIKTLPPFSNIRPSKIGIILSMMCSDLNLLEKSKKVVSGSNYVQEYKIK